MELKLFVVNENSGDPSKWSIWSEWALVLAESKEQALSMVPGSVAAAEVDCSKPVVLVQQTEPNWGEDL